VFFPADFTVLGVVFGLFGLLVPDVLFGVVVAFLSAALVDALAAGFDLLTILLVAWTFDAGLALGAVLMVAFAFCEALGLGFGVDFTVFSFAAGAFLAAALSFGFTTAPLFEAFFARLLAGKEVLLLVAVLVVALALVLILALAVIAPAF
jgi:hypothetical protein